MRPRFLYGLKHFINFVNVGGCGGGGQGKQKVLCLQLSAPAPQTLPRNSQHMELGILEEFWRQKCELKYQLQHTAFPIAVTVYSCVMLLHFLDALDRSNGYIMFSDFGDIYRIYRVCKLVLRLFHFLFLSVTLSKIPWHQCDKYPTFINSLNI